jgi:predicted DNA-binding transcriptional regulator AlpA
MKRLKNQATGAHTQSDRAENQKDAEARQRRLLRLPAIQQRVPWSRSTIWRKVRAGEFPQPIRLGGNSIAWLEDEVQAWIAARISASREAI